MSSERPYISVVIPAFREANYIARCLTSIAQQTYGPGNYEIVVVDGMSDDGTREIIQSLQKQHPNIRMIDNPKRITPVAMNIGVNASKGEFIARLDAHASVPTNYLERCMEAMTRVDAEVVGGPIETRGEGYWGKMIEYILSSLFGVGGSFRTLMNYNGYVDTLAFGLYKKEALLGAGLHDEKLKRGQDWDLNYKIQKAGGRIYLDSRIRPIYYCANNPVKFIKKSLRDGYWIAAIFERRSWRHLAPFFFLVSIVALALLCYWRRYPKGHRLGYLYFPLWLYLSFYYFVALLYSLGMVRRNGWSAVIFGPIMYAAFHLSRGIGIMYGLLTGVWLRI